MSTIYIVSLGSGEPENISLKAFRALTQCDVIFSPNGEAIRMLERLDTSGQLMRNVVPLGIPMDKTNESNATSIYISIADQIIDYRQRGKKIAVVTIGDAGIYSSAFKIINILNTYNIPYEVLPGIPSFVATMALAKCSLVAKNNNLSVLANIASESDILSLLKKGDTVVVMKLSMYQEMIKEVIRSKGFPFVYIENIGSREQFISTNREELMARTFPYLSLIILKGQEL